MSQGCLMTRYVWLHVSAVGETEV